MVTLRAGTLARRGAVLVAAAAALAAAAVASLALGAVEVPFAQVVDALRGELPDGPARKIVLELRLPTTAEAIAVGAALGVAGAVLQGALANPLASPDVIGVTAGAGFGATLILLAFPASVALLPLGALAFGLLAAALVFAIAWTGRNRGGIGRVILAGIAVAALFGAGTTALMTAFPDRVQSVIFFLAGGITPNGWVDLKAFWPYFAVGFVLALSLIRPLDRLALGDDVAASLGSRPQLVRLVAGVCAALLASAAAALVGLLSFLGLLIPHLVRMAGGTSAHGFVIPASALAGAALLTAGDVFARNIAAPVVLPVGPFMVILSVPLFLWLLRRTV
jgi:iron complex transport system permease protein